MDNELNCHLPVRLSDQTYALVANLPGNGNSAKPKENDNILKRFENVGIPQVTKAHVGCATNEQPSRGTRCNSSRGLGKQI